MSLSGRQVALPRCQLRSRTEAVRRTPSLRPGETRPRRGRLVSVRRGTRTVRLARSDGQAATSTGPEVDDRKPAVRRLGDMMVDGVIPLREVALRPLGLSGPSTRTWRQENAGSRPRCIGDGGAARAERVLCGRQPLLSEFAECVVAAFEQLAHDPEQGAVAAESLGGLPVEVVVWRAGPPRGLGGFV